MSEVPVVPAGLSRVDLVGGQAKAIAARLQLVFPPSLFQFRVMPPNAAGDRKAWESMTGGNQPFLGLGFVGITPKTEGNVFMGVVTWMLLCAVRQRGGTSYSLFLGDAQSDGVLQIAAAAAAVLQGAPACTGSLQVTKLGNAVSGAWDDSTAVVALTLEVPVRLTLADLITNPGENLFEELATTWNFPNASGSQDIYTSDWENPNVPT